VHEEDKSRPFFKHEGANWFLRTGLAGRLDDEEIVFTCVWAGE
jgi:hypothetical protein